MAILRFDIDKVLVLCNHAKNATAWRNTFGDETETPEPKLWLVGDHGVYLMSNGYPPLPTEPEGYNVCYAKGIDPRKDGDLWYDRKVDKFGGDDGVDPLDCVDDILGWYNDHPDITEIHIHLSDNEMKISAFIPVPV